MKFNKISKIVQNCSKRGTVCLHLQLFLLIHFAFSKQKGKNLLNDNDYNIYFVFFMVPHFEFLHGNCLYLKMKILPILEYLIFKIQALTMWQLNCQLIWGINILG